jgi:hypothetical protein
MFKNGGQMKMYLTNHNDAEQQVTFDLKTFPSVSFGCVRKLEVFMKAFGNSDNLRNYSKCHVSDMIVQEFAVLIFYRCNL